MTLDMSQKNWGNTWPKLLSWVAWPSQTNSLQISGDVPCQRPEFCRVPRWTHHQGKQADSRNEKRCRNGVRGNCWVQQVDKYYSSCGLILHPDAPWSGATPDNVVFDPTEHPQFGLVEIKCPNVKNFIKYLQMDYGSISLKKQQQKNMHTIGTTTGLWNAVVWAQAFRWPDVLAPALSWTGMVDSTLYTWHSHWLGSLCLPYLPLLPSIPDCSHLIC